MPCKRMLHPVLIVAIGEVLVGMGATALLALLGGMDRGRGVGQQVAELPRLDQVRVPDQRVVGDLHVVEHLDYLVHLLHALGEHIRGPVHGGVRLHRVLHLASDLRGRDRALGVAELV
eukprot:5032983-Prorocentrum_lima.AAC.1